MRNLNSKMSNDVIERVGLMLSLELLQQLREAQLKSVVLS